MNDNSNHTNNQFYKKFLIIHLKAHPIKYFTLHPKNKQIKFKNIRKELYSFLEKLDILENE